MIRTSQNKSISPRHSELLKGCTVVSAIGLVWTAGCSEDSPIDWGGPNSAGRGGGVPVVSAGAGGKTAAVGAAGRQNGTAAGATAGGSRSSGASAGAANPTSGGNAQAGNGQAIAGAATTQGGTGQGGISTQSGAGGLVGGATGAATCPAYVGTGGVLITPPSNGFEADIGDWTTMTGKVSSLTRKQMAPSTCQGSWYFTCDGASRGGPWDGPKFILLPYVVPGHEYVVTLAARFAPENAPAAASLLILSTVNACSDSSVATRFRRLQPLTTLTDWMRFSGTVKASMEGCTQLSEVTIYIETEAADQAYSIDVDDFQLWDVTSATANGGAGGVAGAPGNGGAAGSASNGGAAGRAGNGGAAGSAGNGGVAGSAGDGGAAGSAGNGGAAGAVM